MPCLLFSLAFSFWSSLPLSEDLLLLIFSTSSFLNDIVCIKHKLIIVVINITHRSHPLIKLFYSTHLITILNLASASFLVMTLKTSAQTPSFIKILQLPSNPTTKRLVLLSKKRIPSVRWVNSGETKHL